VSDSLYFKLGALPNSSALNLADCQVHVSWVWQGGVGLAHIADPRRLNLTVRQAQGDVGLAHMIDQRRLNFALSQVQDNDHPSLAYLGERPISIGSNLMEELSFYRFSYT
jgi:hypothetical protein